MTKTQCMHMDCNAELQHETWEELKAAGWGLDPNFHIHIVCPKHAEKMKLIGKTYVCPITRYTMTIVEEAAYPYPDEIDEGEKAYLVINKAGTFSNVHKEKTIVDFLESEQLEALD